MVRKATPESGVTAKAPEERSAALMEVLRKPEAQRVRFLEGRMRKRNKIATRIAELKRQLDPVDDDIADFVTAPENESLVRTVERLGFKPNDKGSGFSIAVEGGKVVAYEDTDIVVPKGDDKEALLKKLAKRLARKTGQPLKEYRRFDASKILNELEETRFATLRERWLQRGRLKMVVQTRITSPKPPKKDEKPAEAPAAQVQAPAAPAETPAPAVVAPAEPAAAPVEQAQPATVTQSNQQ